MFDGRGLLCTTRKMLLKQTPILLREPVEPTIGSTGGYLLQIRLLTILGTNTLDVDSDNASIATLVMLT